MKKKINLLFLSNLLYYKPFVLTVQYYFIFIVISDDNDDVVEGEMMKNRNKSLFLTFFPSSDFSSFNRGRETSFNEKSN